MYITIEFQEHWICSTSLCLRTFIITNSHCNAANIHKPYENTYISRGWGVERKKSQGKVEWAQVHKWHGAGLSTLDLLCHAANVNRTSLNVELSPRGIARRCSIPSVWLLSSPIVSSIVEKKNKRKPRNQTSPLYSLFHRLMCKKKIFVMIAVSNCRRFTCPLDVEVRECSYYKCRQKQN